MTKLRVQQYMEKHKLTPLFEDLMNRVLHEQPDDPIVYLIKCLYKKAAIPVPKDLKSSPVRKSSPERLARRARSPDKGATQAWAVASGPDLVDRSYEKPWLHHSKKVKGKEEEKSDSRQGKRPQQKSGWVSDTKVTATSFDELFEEDPHKTEPGTRNTEHGGTRQRKDEATDITKAWSRHVGLDDSEDPNYRSRGYSGPRCQRNDDDPLAGEIMLAKEESTVESAVSTSKPMGAKLEAARHRQDLEKLLQESDKVSLDSGFDGGRNDEVDDDAIELLEDPEDLMREGVTNIPKSGYKLSRILRHRQEEANVKLNINLFTGTRPPESEFGNQYGDYYESDLERPPTGMSYQSNRFSELSPDISDDEFESVSQVVGPRHPVWSVPDSDGETYRVEPNRKARQNKFSSTAPVRFEEKPPFPRKSSDSENIFLAGNKTWTPGPDRTDRDKITSESPVNVRDSVRSLRSEEGRGWNIPDETEVSIATEWSEPKTSGRASPGPPKAY